MHPRTIVQTCYFTYCFINASCMLPSSALLACISLLSSVAGILHGAEAGQGDMQAERDQPDSHQLVRLGWPVDPLCRICVPMEHPPGI